MPVAISGTQPIITLGGAADSVAGVMVTPPYGDDFSLVNQSNVSVTDNGNSFTLSTTLSLGGGYSGQAVSLTSSSFTVTCGLVPLFNVNGGSMSAVCLFVRDSASGKAEVIYIGSTSGNAAEFGAEKWDTMTSRNSTIVSAYSPTHNLNRLPEWLRITDTGTTRTFHFSYDGVFFYQLASISSSSFLGTPTQAGVALRTGGDGAAGVTCFHWKVE